MLPRAAIEGVISKNLRASWLAVAAVARYVKVTLPEKPAAGVNVKPPFGASVNVPLETPDTSTAVSGPGFGFVSFASTPLGPLTVNASPCSVS